MRKSARDDNKIVASSGNVFADLGFDDAEAQVMALRADLIAHLGKDHQGAQVDLWRPPRYW